MMLDCVASYVAAVYLKQNIKTNKNTTNWFVRSYLRKPDII